MKIVAIIPIKMNNERLPGKNIKEFDDGTPLCQLLFNNISSVKNIDDVYCFCSDQTIQKYLPVKINYLERSEGLDSQSATSNDIIASFMSKIDSDIYVLTHATGPFIKPSSIEACVNAVKSGEYDSAMTVETLHEFLWVDGEPFNYDPGKIARTQDLPVIFKETCGVYVFTKELFLKHGRRVGFKPYFHEVSFIEGIDIDNIEDFEVANAIYKDVKSKNYLSGVKFYKESPCE